MTRTSDQFDYTQLSVAERILLAEEIWDSIAAEGHPIALTKEQERTLNQRLGDYKASREAFPTWDDVKKRLRSKP